ncbi:MAG: response regulator [Alphaproteobacteria bacterium]|nr:response regulator [Alphaproteobacteria bacterium]MCB9975662.1 response regulator [Rhodospirillales bacterium]
MAYAGKADFKDLKVLVVEDQNEARAMLRNMLGELGITQIFEASDGREAFSFVDSAFDLVNFILCDWNMPGMTGVEFLRQVRSVNMDTPFLMITGRGDMGSVTEAKSSGVTGYIKKPFSASQLEAKIRIILQRHGMDA